VRRCCGQWRPVSSSTTEFLTINLIAIAQPSLRSCVWAPFCFCRHRRVLQRPQNNLSHPHPAATPHPFASDTSPVTRADSLKDRTVRDCQRRGAYRYPTSKAQSEAGIQTGKAQFLGRRSSARYQKACKERAGSRRLPSPQTVDRRHERLAAPPPVGVHGATSPYFTLHRRRRTRWPLPSGTTRSVHELYTHNATCTPFAQIVRYASDGCGPSPSASSAPARHADDVTLHDRPVGHGPRGHAPRHEGCRHRPAQANDRLCVHLCSPFIQGARSFKPPVR
jgi:hypothetical protein